VGTLLALGGVCIGAASVGRPPAAGCKGALSPELGWCCTRPQPSLHPRSPRFVPGPCLAGVCLTDVTSRDLKKGQAKVKLGPLDDLIAGLVAGVPAAFVTCPLDVIKTRMQSCGVVSHVLGTLCC